MGKTNIEWATDTWNPFTGCTAVSPGCDHCYAARDASGRLAHLPAYAGLAAGGKFTGEVRLLPDRLDQPKHWRRPRRIFVNSMGDLFHEAVSDEYIARVWQVMASCPQHTFIILTKRHARMRAWVNRCKESPGGWITHDGTDPAGAYNGTGVIVGYPPPRARRPDSGVGPRGGKPRFKPTPPAYGWPLPNVWLGVSVEDQRWADIRIPALLDTPAAVRFLSCEPLLGPVNIWHLIDPSMPCVDCDQCGDERFADEIGVGHDRYIYDDEGRAVYDDAGDQVEAWCEGPSKGTLPRRIDWVIAGGESGPQARPMHPDWARRLRDDCRAAGIPFFFKQWGEHAPYAIGDATIAGYNGPLSLVSPDGKTHSPRVGSLAPAGSVLVARYGKHRAGNRLDGAVWEQYPRPLDGAAA